MLGVKYVRLIGMDTCVHDANRYRGGVKYVRLIGMNACKGIVVTVQPSTRERRKPFRRMYDRMIIICACGQGHG